MVIPNYSFACKKCEKVFEEICSFADFDLGFPNLRCPSCNSKKFQILLGAPEVVFANPRESSKWDNWYYRQGKTAEEAKMQSAAARKAAGGKSPYKQIDDTDGGRRMDFIQ